MPIVDKLIAEVREACAVEAIRLGSSGIAEEIRKDGNRFTANVVQAGLDAISNYFKDCEEVEAGSDGAGDLWPVRRWGPVEATGRKAVTVLVFPKPVPEMLTVSRETLAVLAEHYEATPDKDAAGDAALTEAKEAL